MSSPWDRRCIARASRYPLRRPRFCHAASVPGAVLLAMLALAIPRAHAQEQGQPSPRRALVHARVAETSGSYRASEPVTFGVPLPQGALKDTRLLRCWREDGPALPIQARALSRWPDFSVRWALIDTQLELQSKQQVGLEIGLAEDIAETPDPWSTRGETEGADAAQGAAEGAATSEPKRSGQLVVSDGVTDWTVLERGGNEDMVLGMGVRLFDGLGHAYQAQIDPSTVRVLESGPLRRVIEVHGSHRPRDAGGLPEFYTFTARLHLLAGQRTARVQWTLENTPLLDPPGALAFKSYELLLGAGGPTDGIDVPFSSETIDDDFRLRQDGPTIGQAEVLVGGLSRKPPRSEDLWAGVLCGNDGTYAHRVDSARNHPAALRHQSGGPLIIGLLPPTPGETFWLDDATQKTFRLTIARAPGRQGRALVQQAARPAFVSLDPQDVADSGAWGDTGAFYVPDRAQLNAPVALPKAPATGWAEWGEWNTKISRIAGSPRNRLSVYLEAVQSRRADLFALNQARAWNAMDLRPYHLRGFSADQYPKANLTEGLPHTNDPPETRLGRTGIEQRFPEYKVGIPPKGHGYNGFDPEHMTLDDVYECYLLTGDWVALDALRSAGEAMLTWHYVMPQGDLFSSRIVGWTLRALVQCARATGDRRYLTAARDMVLRANERRGKGEVKYLCRLRPDPRRLPDQESEAPWMVAVAMHGLCAYWYETKDPTVPPMLHDLTKFIMSAWRGNGFAGYLPVDGPASAGVESEPLGTSQWIPGALAAAAVVLKEHAPIDKIYPFYRQMHALTRNCPVAFGDKNWHWWQSYLVTMKHYHGARAVNDPAHFDPGQLESR